MKTIRLTRGYRAIVDVKDFKRLSKRKWQANVGRFQIRAVRSEKRKLVFMHHIVLQITTKELKKLGLEVDHINRNSLDNRRRNLRLVTHWDNMLNSKRHLERVGYCYNKRAKLWCVYLDRPKKKRVYLGYCKTKGQAQKRIKEARLAYS